VIEASGTAPTIIEEFDPSLPLVEGNADALVQVLINLLANAADATVGQPERRIAIRTRFASGLQLHTGADGRALRLPIELRISDNGPGIAADLREHVFEPFVSSKKTGQGLGLALVRRLLRDMNARINHDREEATGLTHFRVHLPLIQERHKAAREEAA
jgi:two-component system nitrogen regulation sensor histidine kinase GlnL